MKMRHFLPVGLLLTTLAPGCAEEPSERNKEVVRQMAQAINKRDFAMIEDLVSADVHRYSGATPDLIVENLEQFLAFLEQDLAAVPDAHQEINLILAEDDLVAIHATYSGTQTGDFGPFPPSGRRLELSFIGILRVEEGKIVEIRVEWDNLSALAQLGHFPPPTGAEGSEAVPEP